ncbi:MAG TPA: TonB-dependent receptor [Candidatus Kapabacteria bacterium]|nr:TonB-dependent receptor [Candidatus Kapabacteria bacterium]
MRYSSLLIAVAIAAMAGTTQRMYAQHRGPGEGPQGKITGTVSDSTNASALGSATITVRSSKDSSVVAGAIADHGGAFVVTGLRPGTYFARVSYVGFVSRVFNNLAITPGEPAVSLGVVALVPDASVGDGVTVTGKREFFTLAIDRTVYKTSDLKIAAGGSASDLLRNIPSVDVDADGKVSLRGSAAVVVQINGRPTMMSSDALAAFLKGLPADAVERVEVIPNPSAKYDPDGMSGIINIVLKQNNNLGFSGGVNGAVGTDPNASLGLNLGYNSGPWNIYANYNFFYERRYGTTDRLRESLIAGPPAALTQGAHDTTFTTTHTLNTSIDYTLAEGHSLNLTAFLNTRNSPTNWLINSAESNAGGDVLDRSQRAFSDHNTGGSDELRLGYKWTVDPGKQELDVEVRGSTSNNKDASSYDTYPLAQDGSPAPGTHDIRKTDRDNTFRDGSLQMDYNRPIGENGRMEAGYKGNLLRMEDNYSAQGLDTLTGQYVTEAASASASTYDRAIHAVYVTYGHDIGPFSLEAGLRAEQAMTTYSLNSTGQTFDNNYFSLFPSAFVSFKPADELQMKASYSRRIQRPEPSQLNPTPEFDDPTFRSVGNPYLKPEYIDSYDFTVAWFFDGGSLSVNPYYRHSTDAISRWESFDTTGLAILTFKNLQSSHSFGANAVATYRAGNWLSAFVATDASQFHYDATNIDAVSQQDALIWSFRGNVTATLLTGLDLQVSYFYRAPMDITGGQIGSFQSGDVALTQKLLGDRATLGLRLSDPFKQMKFTVDHTYSGFHEVFTQKWNTRTLSLTFSYSFGNPGQHRQQHEPHPDAGSHPGMGM